MRRRRTWLFIALPLAAALLPLGAIAADAAAPASESGLLQALAFAAPDTSLVTFTDWDRLKTAYGLESLDSTLPEDLRPKGMLELTEDDGIFSGCGLRHIRGHAETWRWDSTELAWDAQILTTGAPAYVLRFRDDLDLAPFVGLLDEREFESRPYCDAVIRSRELDLGSDWVRTTELASQNVALLPDGHTVALSGSTDVLEAMLDAVASTTPEETAASPAGQIAVSLESPSSAAIELGPDACTAYSDTSFAGDPDVDAALVASVGPLSAWEAMGVATCATAGAPSMARLVFLLGDPAFAEAEAEARARIAREGHSLVIGMPYGDIAFEAADASADGAIARIDLVPVDGRSHLVARRLFWRDLLPARCDPA